MITVEQKRRVANGLEAMSYAGYSLRTKLGWYAAQFGLEFRESMTTTEELRRKIFDRVLVRAKELITDADRHYLDGVTFVVDYDNIRYTAAPLEELSPRSPNARVIVTNATMTRLPHDNNVCITLYPAAHRLTKELTKTQDDWVEWTRRLILHEIGHGRDGLSDEEMARRFNY